MSTKLLENLKSRLKEVQESRMEDREELIMMSDDHKRYTKVKNSLKSLERKITRYLQGPNCTAHGFYRMKLWPISYGWQYCEGMQKESSTVYKASKKSYLKLLHEEKEIMKDIKLEEDRIYREDIDLNCLFSDMVEPETVVQVIDNLIQVIS